MNNGQLKSALVILRHLIRAPEGDKNYLLKNLSDGEIKNIGKLVSSSLKKKGVVRHPKQKGLIRKHRILLRKLTKARNSKEIKRVRKSFKKVGGGIITSILLSLVGSALSGAISGAIKKK